MSAQRKPSIASRVSAGLRGYDSVGKPVRSVEIAPDGTVRFLTGKPGDIAELTGAEPNEWDEVLPRG